MLSIFQAAFASLALRALTAQAATYRLTDNWQGSTFWNGFSFQDIADPTNGRVQYVNQQTARSLNLTYTSDSPPHIVIRADSTEVLRASGPGRKSVRVRSLKQFSHNTVLVADILHMPQGCGTWPALWTTEEDNWPARGEIDIVENVNDMSPNHVTLHTTPGCTMSGSRPQTGQTISTDCNWLANSNQGCVVQVDKAPSYGPAFNANGGGIYAIERTSNQIKAWYWTRAEVNAGRAPVDIPVLGQGAVNTDTWGTPVAVFTSNSCDISSKFGPNNVIINLTFCGDWAGVDSIYQGAGCPGTCIDYVNNNPSVFRNAYWDFKAIRMYGL